MLTEPIFPDLIYGAPMKTSEAVRACTSAFGQSSEPDDERYFKALSSIKRIKRHSEKPIGPNDFGQRLYMVTTMARNQSHGGTRTVAICDFSHANEMVLQNIGDIYETSYGLLVIEAVLVNALYGGSLDQQYWYAWVGDSQTGGYVPIKTPDAFVGLTGFSIG